MTSFAPVRARGISLPLLFRGRSCQHGLVMAVSVLTFNWSRDPPGGYVRWAGTMLGAQAQREWARGVLGAVVIGKWYAPCAHCAQAALVSWAKAPPNTQFPRRR